MRQSGHRDLVVQCLLFVEHARSLALDNQKYICLESFEMGYIIIVITALGTAATKYNSKVIFILTGQKNTT